MTQRGTGPSPVSAKYTRARRPCHDEGVIATMAYNIAQISELFPDINTIGDKLLREKVAAVWSEALTTGCGGKGWTFAEIRAIPFTLLAGKIDLRFVEHLNSCVKQCIVIEGVLKEIYGDRIPINHDHL